MLIWFVFITSIIGVCFYISWYNSPSQKGIRGEAWIHGILEQLPDEYKVLEDVILKKENNTTTQIDHLVVSKYGLFAIETKNYRGDIYGDDKRQEWLQIIVTDVTYSRKWWKTYTYVTKNKFYNPVKQAYGHIYEIKKQLTDWSCLKIVPIVVFVGSADLKHVHTNNHVIYSDELLNTIYGYKTIYLSDCDVEHIINKLNRINVRDSVDNKSHILNIKASKKELQNKLAAGICPRCGGQLIQRNGRYGKFFGCSNYPDCKFTHH